MARSFAPAAATLAVASGLMSTDCLAATDPLLGATASNFVDQSPPGANDGPLGGYFDGWEARVAEALSSQPAWVPPLLTLSPLITELVRWDVNYQVLGTGADILNLGSGKGVFLVPTTTNEVDVGLPSYERRYGPHPSDGLGDYPFFLVKQRLLSANGDDGNYILTASLGAQAPAGAPSFTNHAYVIIPGILGGKGFGNLNIQAATRFAIPTSHGSTLGTAWTTDVTFQYHIPKLLLWPEFEINSTHWLGGMQHGGQNQLFLTFGAIIGAIPIGKTTALTFGAGYQFAVAPERRLEPALIPTYDHNFVFTGRLLF